MNKKKWMSSIVVISILITFLLMVYASQFKTRKEIDNLKKELNQQEKEKEQIKTSFLKLAGQSILFLNPSDVGAGFQSIRDTKGTFTFILALDDLKKFPGGYKAYFSLGNPYFCFFKEIPVNLAWGYDRLSLLSQAKPSAITVKSLKPASWTKFEMIISPADEQSIQNIGLVIQPPQQVILAQ